MVELLIGKKGTGKTKALIEKVNNALTVAATTQTEIFLM